MRKDFVMSEIRNSVIDLHEMFIKQQLNVVGNTPATIKNLRANFQLLLKFKPDLTLEDLTEKTLAEFFEFLNTRERKVGKEYLVRSYKNSSLATVRGKLNTFFKWLIERDYLKSSPFEKMPFPEVSYKIGRASC